MILAEASSSYAFVTGAVSVLAGIGAILGALGVVTATRSFRAVMGLLVVIVCLSIEFVMLAAPVIAFIQILVYAGAVVVLFLFVVMLLDLRPAGSDTARHGPVRWDWAMGSAAALVTICLCGIYYHTKMTPPPTIVADPDLSAAESIGNALFVDYLVSFEAAAVFLLAAVIAAIYIAHPRQPGEKASPDEETEPAAVATGDASCDPAGADTPAVAGKEAS